MKIMEQLNNRTLAILSLLVIPGILLMPMFIHSYVVIIPIIWCFVGKVSCVEILYRIGRR